MAMKNKQLKELLNQYSDESLVYIRNGDCDNDCEHIRIVNVRYYDSDEYKAPDIILN